MLEGKRVGDIVFSPDISAEIYEKWIGFLAIIVAATVLTAHDRDHRLFLPSVRRFGRCRIWPTD